MSPKRYTPSRLRRGASGLEFLIPGRPRRLSQRLRIRRLLWLIALGLGIILVAESTYALLSSRRFLLQEVRVVGATTSSKVMILSLAPSVPGPNLFLLPNKAITQRILMLSFVEQVSLEKWPPHTLIIKVVERTPIAFLRQEPEIFYLDKAGVAFYHPGPIPPDLIEVQGLVLTEANIGHPLGGVAAEALRTGLTAFAKYPQIKIKRLTVDAKGWLTASLAAGTELRLGSTVDLDKKLEQAKSSLALLNSSRPAAYLDLSAPEAAVWKPRR